MSILKYLERARRMDDLIRRKATGNAEEFAKKLGISRSVLMDHLRDLRDLGAPIQYDETSHCYYYAEEFSLFIRERDKLKSYEGGNYLHDFLAVRYYRTLGIYF